jgi:hypothetical protein
MNKRFKRASFILLSVLPMLGSGQTRIDIFDPNNRITTYQAYEMLNTRISDGDITAFCKVHVSTIGDKVFLITVSQFDNVLKDIQENAKLESLAIIYIDSSNKEVVLKNKELVYEGKRIISTYELSNKNLKSILSSTSVSFMFKQSFVVEDKTFDHNTNLRQTNMISSRVTYNKDAVKEFLFYYGTQHPGVETFIDRFRAVINR